LSQTFTRGIQDGPMIASMSRARRNGLIGTGETPPPDRYPPTLGEDNARVLADVLQWDCARIAALVDAGVLKAATA
jgi:crotonobetainyl-CoA:carnitine CoA-transferase CaiB-like acyl-CoA transferase